MKFNEYSLRDLLSHIVDNRGRSCPTVERGIPLIATNCIKNTGLYPVFEKVRYVSEKTYQNWFRGHPEPGDMIFVCKGSPGRVCWVPDPVPFCIAQDMVAIRADESKVHPKYLFALLRSDKVQNKILNMHVGTLIPHFKKGDFSNLYLRVPEDLEYQKKVGEAYFLFCEKIENNYQINQNLEQMAQALFKSWFVDFEPVKAKIAARQRWQALQSGSESACFAAEQEDQLEVHHLDTLMNRGAMQAISGKTAEQLDALSAEDPEHYNSLNETAALFPSAMQESELGEIPEGWGCLALDQVAKYQNGLALQKFRPESEDEYLPVVKISQLRKGYADGGEKASPNINPECIIDNGDVVFSWSGSLMVDTWCGGRAALNQHLFKVTSSKYPKWLYFYFTKHHLEEFQRIAADKAVTMGHIKRKHLKQALCAVPSSTCVSIGKAVESIFEKQIKMRLEILTLTQLRDALLPELLSGKAYLLSRGES